MPYKLSVPFRRRSKEASESIKASTSSGTAITKVEGEVTESNSERFHADALHQWALAAIDADDDLSVSENEGPECHDALPIPIRPPLLQTSGASTPKSVPDAPPPMSPPLTFLHPSSSDCSTPTGETGTDVGIGSLPDMEPMHKSPPVANPNLGYSSLFVVTLMTSSAALAAFGWSRAAAAVLFILSLSVMLAHTARRSAAHITDAARNTKLGQAV
mmetsp:Transcript_33289/g.87602  ORF Transcript_33289/g.87602 Transcript_33289/m.87602 type:complete len:216 (+) Transcript_33289:52-699(+)